MKKLALTQKTTQKILPQQIQFAKMISYSHTDFQKRVVQEIAENPLLEVNVPEANNIVKPNGEKDEKESTLIKEDVTQLEAIVNQIQVTDYMKANQPSDNDLMDLPIASDLSQTENLLKQLHLLSLTEKEKKIGIQIIGSLDEDGYLRLSLDTLMNDFMVTYYEQTNTKEVEQVLKQIQTLEPVGIGSRNLQEYLYTQLTQQRSKNNQSAHEIAIEIIAHHFEAFTKKHYLKIMKKMKLTDSELLQQATQIISKLKPSPIQIAREEWVQNEVLHPDFLIIKKPNNILEVTLADNHLPKLKLKRNYQSLFKNYRSQKDNPKGQEAFEFFKKKLEDAKIFLNAIQQRENTLLKTMRAIVKFQEPFFLQEDEKQLKPLLIKQIAEDIQMDSSTVSRIVNNKSVQTKWGVYPLKFFFSKKIIHIDGKQLIDENIKQALIKIINEEDKKKPYVDEKLTKLMNAAGYNISRRTVNKYREALKIPPARLRKKTL